MCLTMNDWAAWNGKVVDQLIVINLGRVMLVIKPVRHVNVERTFTLVLDLELERR